jgi:hypothetical protein
LSSVFPCRAFECSAIQLAASCSVVKPLITSVSPSGHRISIPQPVPGFFRAMKVGSCSSIRRICTYGSPIQASYPAPIKLSHCARDGRLLGPSESPVRVRLAGCSWAGRSAEAQAHRRARRPWRLRRTSRRLGCSGHSRKAQRHRAEYIRWQRCVSKLGHKIPQQYYVGADQERFKRKRPRRGAGGAGVHL